MPQLQGKNNVKHRVSILDEALPKKARDSHTQKGGLAPLWCKIILAICQSSESRSIFQGDIFETWAYLSITFAGNRDILPWSENLKWSTKAYTPQIIVVHFFLPSLHCCPTCKTHTHREQCVPVRQRPPFPPFARGSTVLCTNSRFPPGGWLSSVWWLHNSNYCITDCKQLHNSMVLAVH